MNCKSFPKTYIVVFVIFVCICIAPKVFSQIPIVGTNNQPPKTTITVDSVEIIPSSEISIYAADQQIRIKSKLSTLLSDHDIDSTNLHLDTVLQKVNYYAVKIDSIIAHTQSIRKLKNIQAQIKLFKEQIESERKDVKKTVVDMNKQIQYLSDQQLLWKNTEKHLDRSAAPIVEERISQILLLLDTASNEYNRKSNKLLNEMDKSTMLMMQLDGKIETIENALTTMEDAFASKRGLSLFSLNYNEISSQDFIESVKQFYRTSCFDLTNYFKTRVNLLLLVIFIFILIYVLLSKYKNRFESYKPGYGEWYKKHLNSILVKHLSASIIITVFVSFFLFFDRPLILRDLIGYILIIPLVKILKTLVDSKFHRIISLLPLFMIPYTFYIIFSAESPIFRITLLVMGLMELGILLQFFSVVKQVVFKTETERKVFHILPIVQIVIASVSVIASILGFVIISQNFMFAVYTNVVFGCALFVCSVLLNGLFLNIVESRKLLTSLRFIQLFEHTLKHRFVAIINIVGSTWWLYMFFSALSMDKGLIKWITEFFSNVHHFGKIDFTVGGFFTFFIVIYLAVMISNIIRVILEEDILNKMSLAKGLPHTIAIMTRYAIITLGVTFALGIAGVEMKNMAVVLSAFGVGIGFGLQNIFNNLVSGFILLFERPIQLGDMIEVGPLLGKVKSIGIRSSNIETVDGAEVIVPNGQLVSSEVVNWTLSDKKKRIEILVGIGYDSNTQAVRGYIEDILAQHSEILLDPPPIVLFNNIGESSLNFRILFWTPEFGQAMKLKSDVTFEIYDDLRARGIEMPFGQYDLNIRTMDDDLLKRIKKKEGDAGDDKRE